MITARTNGPYPNRIQLPLGDWIRPFVQPAPGTLGDFDPRRDLEVYVDGLPVAVQTFSYDSINNRYLLFLEKTIDLQGSSRSSTICQTRRSSMAARLPEMP